jgi:hypothetical protein
MTPVQLNTFKTALVAAIEAHLASGGKISDRRFAYQNERCPIGCLAFEEMATGIHNIYSQAVSAKLGFEVSTDEMYCFADGFDCCDNYNVGTELYYFGQQLRRKYLRN